jgi:hypothetical protein
MISAQETVIINVIRKGILNKRVSTNQGGHSGRDVEGLIEDLGFNINRGPGCDMPEFDWEIKSRKLTAQSAQTVTAMYADDIKITPYAQSAVKEKLNKWVRVTIDENDIISKVELLDFNQPQIQELFEDAYEHGRQIITKKPDIGYTPYPGYWGYFEQTRLPNNSAYDFRFSDSDIDTLIGMTKTTFNSILTYTP